MTQRAYTMRLHGPKDGGDSWRDLLWITHEKVNRGAKVFGDFLLTLRGGLPASAIDGAEDDLAARRRLFALCWFTVESEDTVTGNFRVSHQDDPGGLGGRRADETAMENALLECLESKGIPASARADWARDCGHALKARIRDDAVWVQRWKMYEGLNPKPDSEQVRAILGELLGSDFLDPLVEEKGGRKARAAEADKDKQEEGAEKGEKSPGRAEQFDHVRRTARRLEGEWFGQGKKRDFPALTAAYGMLKKIAEELAKAPPRTMPDLKKRILAVRETAEWASVQPKKKNGRIITVGEPALANSGPSPRARSGWEKVLFAVRADEPDASPSGGDDQFLKADFWKRLSDDAGKTIGKKSQRGAVEHGADWAKSLLARMTSEVGIAYQPGSEMTEFFRFMLGAAAARLAQTHSWVRRAEALRDDASAKGRELSAKFQDAAWSNARQWLDEYLERRSERSGAFGLMAIRRNAIDGWDKVVQRWAGISTAGEQAVEERRAAVKELEESEEKFGDAALFDALASDEASCVWRRDGKPAPELLRAFVEWRKAEYDAQRYKVPRYCHPDALLHPVFCQFGSQKPGIDYGWRKDPKTTDRAQATKVELLLLDRDGKADKVAMRWQGKRLLSELGFSETAAQFSEISRDTRLGRGASGAASFDAPRARPKHLFEKGAKPWNARLEAPRWVLERMAKLEGKPDQAKRLQGRIGWFLTFSPDLIKRGPWHSFAALPKTKNVLESGGAPVSVNARKGTTYWKGGFGWMVRPGLGLLPGIRVLGMDLGHRHGAACAVWQQVSGEEVKEAAVKAGVKPPADADISFRCDDPSREPCTAGPKKGSLPRFVFRRVGPDAWARLERQFLIRLPGEIEGARPLAAWERGWLEGFIEGLGKAFGSDEERRRWKKRVEADVSSARLEALRLAARALRRHGDRARIAHALASRELPGMGGRMQNIASAEDRLPHLVKALGLWDSLASSTWWHDTTALDMWTRYVAAVVSELGAKLPVSDEGASLQAAKAARRKREELYTQAASSLASDAKLSREIADLFFATWAREDAAWEARLGDLSRWIAKGAVRDETGKWSRNPQAQRNAGGLSLGRISALEHLARLQRAFAQRPTRETVFRMAEEGETHGRRVREKLERLREDRLKKLANAVAMAAMGLVGMEKDKLSRVEKARREGPRFAPAHAVVIESLSHYRPEASRTRRENRGLMSWSAREMAKRLKDQCDLHGLLMLEASAAYTSRFCSRCGAPGVRCENVRLGDIGSNPYWMKERAKASAAVKAQRAPYQRYVLDLDPKKDPERRVPIPREGGAMFFCSNGGCRVSGGGLQADLNAAANIGIRSMLDGRWQGAWQYLPTSGTAADLKSFALKGAPEGLGTLAIRIGGGAVNGRISRRSKGKSDGRNVFNSFRDIAQGIDPASSVWKQYRPFWQEALVSVSERLCRAYRTEKQAVPAKNS